MTAHLQHRDATSQPGVNGRTAVWTTVAIAAIAVSLLAVRQGAAQTQDSPGYFGPIRFQRQTFTTIRPQPITIPNQRFSTFPRQTIPPTPFPRDRIVIPPITQTRIPRDTFAFSNSIFGPTDGAKAGQAAEQKKQSATQFRAPYRSRSIRPLSR